MVAANFASLGCENLYTGGESRTLFSHTFSLHNLCDLVEQDYSLEILQTPTLCLIMPVSPDDIVKVSVNDGSSLERVKYRTSTLKLEIVDYNPAWPQQFLDNKARIEGTLGSNIINIFHVGSTSVPGLPAKDVLDIDLVVKDVKDEGSYVAPLERVGFRFLFREPTWHEHRFFVDEGNRPDTYPINLHVFGPDCPEVERHQIFRERLIRSSEDLQLYAEVKREAVVATHEAGESLQQYTARKSDVVRDILDRAFRELGYIK